MTLTNARGTECLIEGGNTKRCTISRRLTAPQVRQLLGVVGDDTRVASNVLCTYFRFDWTLFRQFRTWYEATTF